MKNKLLSVALALGLGISMNAQTAFNGNKDKKISISGTFQTGAKGLAVTFDKGVAENISVGIQAGYLLSFAGENTPTTGVRAHVAARFNANIGNTIGLPSNMDIYPGLNLGLKNFGGHLGYRLLLNGFGLYSEVIFPISKYGSSNYANLNNQSTVHVGVVLGLN